MRETRPTIHVSFDGVEHEAFVGESILACARRNGVTIPSLCFLEGLTVWGGCRICVVEVAEDHRLRAWFPTGIRTDTVLSDGHFHLVPRPVPPPSGADWVQPHPGTYPQQDFTAVADAGGRGLAIIAAGLPEVAPRPEPHDRTATVQLTLLRCVGWLSRDDLPTRRHTNAGPTMATPEAQCPGEHRFRYALLPFVGDPLEAVSS